MVKKHQMKKKAARQETTYYPQRIIGLEWWRVWAGTESYRRSLIERVGITCTLRCSSWERRDRFCYIDVVPIIGQGFVHICTEEAVAVAPWQYHISLCQWRPLRPNDLWTAWTRVCQRWDGQYVHLTVEKTHKTCVVVLAPTNPPCMDADVRTLRGLGSHSAERLTVSMGF